MKKSKKIGFTLIELLITVMIVALLAAIAAPQYTKMVEKSRASDALTNLRSIADAANRYYVAKGSYKNINADPDSASLNLDIKPAKSRYYTFTLITSGNHDIELRALKKNDPMADGYYDHSPYMIVMWLHNGEITATGCTDLESGTGKDCDNLNIN